MHTKNVEGTSLPKCLQIQVAAFVPQQMFCRRVSNPSPRLESSLTHLSLVHQSNDPGHMAAAFEAHQSLVIRGELTVDRHDSTRRFHVSWFGSRHAPTVESPQDSATQLAVFHLLNRWVHGISFSACERVGSG